MFFHGLGTQPNLKIARWLLPVCSKAKVIHADGSESGNKSSLRLDLCQWQLAWDRYAIGAVVLDQVSVICRELSLG